MKCCVFQVILDSFYPQEVEKRLVKPVVMHFCSHGRKVNIRADAMVHALWAAAGAHVGLRRKHRPPLLPRCRSYCWRATRWCGWRSQEMCMCPVHGSAQT